MVGRSSGLTPDAPAWVLHPVRIPCRIPPKRQDAPDGPWLLQFGGGSSLGPFPAQCWPFLGPVPRPWVSHPGTVVPNYEVWCYLVLSRYI